MPSLQSNIVNNPSHQSVIFLQGQARQAHHWSEAGWPRTGLPSLPPSYYMGKASSWPATTQAKPPATKMPSKPSCFTSWIQWPCRLLTPNPSQKQNPHSNSYTSCASCENTTKCHLRGLCMWTGEELEATTEETPRVYLHTLIMLLVPEGKFSQTIETVNSYSMCCCYKQMQVLCKILKQDFEIYVPTQVFSTSSWHYSECTFRDFMCKCLRESKIFLLSEIIFCFREKSLGNNCQFEESSFTHYTE